MRIDHSANVYHNNSRKIGLDITFKLSPKDTICINIKAFFLEIKTRNKNKKKIFQNVVC